MSIFHRLTDAEIAEHFTHVGLFMGLVPVYVSMEDDGVPGITTRNWVPEWTLTTVTWITQLIGSIMDDPSFRITITGKIE